MSKLPAAITAAVTGGSGIEVPPSSNAEPASKVQCAEAKPARAWTPVDDADLIAAVRHGVSLDAAALFLCRSPSEVARRGTELGLRWATLICAADLMVFLRAAAQHLTAPLQ
jgi:hypothetical protein